MNEQELEQRRAELKRIAKGWRVAAVLAVVLCVAAQANGNLWMALAAAVAAGLCFIVFLTLDGVAS